VGGVLRTPICGQEEAEAAKRLTTKAPRFAKATQGRRRTRRGEGADAHAFEVFVFFVVKVFVNGVL